MNGRPLACWFTTHEGCRQLSDGVDAVGIAATEGGGWGWTPGRMQKSESVHLDGGGGGGAVEPRESEEEAKARRRASRVERAEEKDQSILGWQQEQAAEQ
jgi:hypothetical protein